MIRVLHLRDTVRVCGPGKTILNTVKQSRDPDVEYRVGAFDESGPNGFLESVETYCPVHRLPPSRLRLPLTAFRLAREIKRRRIDIVHAHDFKTDLLAVLVAMWQNAPLVTTVHGYIAISTRSRAYAGFDRWLLRRMDRVIAVSKQMVEDLRLWGVPPERIRVVRNSIVLDPYPFRYRSERLRTTEGLAADDLLVGAVGRLSPEKGQRGLLEIFPDVIRQVPQAKLVLAGDGPDERRLAEMRATMGLGDSVRLLGHRSDIRDVYGSLDLLVLNSATEGLPNVVLEAMALGVPVVATAVGGTPELVTDGETGRLVRPGDRAGLARAVVEALKDRQRSSAWATSARRLVEREFDMQVLIEQTHRLYRELVPGDRGHGA